MISVIVSTRAIDDSFVDMVKKTSGVKDIEVLIYENNGEMSLTQVYNKGLSESNNDILVFMHDDVQILTNNWGRLLLKHYNSSHYGILGVAGTKNLNSNGIWWSNKESMYGRVYHTDGKKEWLSEYSNNFFDKIKEVVVVDGVFISCSKSRIKEKFNEYYDGFHFYDISFCFDNFKSNVSIGVISNISILHKSVGQTNQQWEVNRLKFIEKEKENLPVKLSIDVKYVEPKINLKNEKKLAVIIPTKNNVDSLLIPCVNSIIENTNYSNYKIYIADTGSDPDELEKTKQFVLDANKTKEIVKLIEYDYYNFAKINNDMVINKIDNDSELLLFCNNDIEMLNDAISIMAGVYDKQDNIGTVGCRLHFEDGTIQHLGVNISVNSKNEMLATHNFLRWDYDNIKLTNSNIITHGNTAAFMMIKKNLFEKLGCFNEIYVECFEDVELNLKCTLNKKLNITNTVAACYHLESQTRTKEREAEDLNKLIKFINLNQTLINTFYRKQ